MSQVFDASGEHLPVTVIQAGPCKVIQVKTNEKDGYTAVQIGFGSKIHLTRAQKGHQRKEHFSDLQEFRIAVGDSLKVGDEMNASNFQPGEYIDVTGTVKGRGFAGVMKRHGFHGFPASHGHDHPRMLGSVGSAFPQHVMKGKRMAGRMGGNIVTVKNLLVVDVDAERNLIFVKGAVPGASSGIVRLKSTGKKMEKPLELYQDDIEKTFEKKKSDGKEKEALVEKKEAEKPKEVKTEKDPKK